VIDTKRVYEAVSGTDSYKMPTLWSIGWSETISPSYELGHSLCPCKSIRCYQKTMLSTRDARDVKTQSIEISAPLVLHWRLGIFDDAVD
jgi:hypothetical protein